MTYSFELHINTDGDFGFKYGPIGMTYDEGCQSYDLIRVYKDKDNAINDVIGIVDFLKNNISTSRTWVREMWLEHCDNFLEKLWNMDNDFIYREMFENYEGTVFRFFANSEPCLSVNLLLTEDEYQMVKNRTDISYNKIKEAVLNLYKNKGENYD